MVLLMLLLIMRKAMFSPRYSECQEILCSLENLCQGRLKSCHFTILDS